MRWGIISTKINERVLPSCGSQSQVELLAVASRSQEVADATRRRRGFPAPAVCEGAAPIRTSRPPHPAAKLDATVEWSLKALEAGKRSLREAHESPRRSGRAGVRRRRPGGADPQRRRLMAATIRRRDRRRLWSRRGRSAKAACCALVPSSRVRRCASEPIWTEAPLWTSAATASAALACSGASRISRSAAGRRAQRRRHALHRDPRLWATCCPFRLRIRRSRQQPARGGGLRGPCASHGRS